MRPRNQEAPEDLDQFGWDPSEIRDLIQTTPLRFDNDGLPDIAVMDSGKVELFLNRSR